MADLKPMRANLRPEKSWLRSEKVYLISERADLRTEGPDLRLTPCLPSSGFMTANFESETVVPVSVVIGNSWPSWCKSSYLGHLKPELKWHIWQPIWDFQGLSTRPESLVWCQKEHIWGMSQLPKDEFHCTLLAVGPLSQLSKKEKCLLLIFHNSPWYLNLQVDRWTNWLSGKPKDWHRDTAPHSREGQYAFLSGTAL